MKLIARFFSGGMSFLIAAFAFATDDANLPSGGDLAIKEIRYNKGLPHAFFDQAMNSLPHLYPDHELLLGVRTAVLGEVEYALICLRETPSSHHVVIEAVAALKGRAWRYKEITPASCEEALAKILGHIGNLPSVHAVQTTPANQKR
jgi:hypothetical protein